MRVAAIRQRVLEKVREVAASGDEEATARIMDYARAVLVALAPLAEVEDVDLEKLTVGTATAAHILSLHPEYLRNLLRNNAIKATKENGEYQIAFPDLVAFLIGVRRPEPGTAWVPRRLPGVRRARYGNVPGPGLTVWQRPQEPRTGE